ncbi:MAG: hypothetical protein ABI876_08620 [Bacteroidota bacterium]
MDMPTCTHEGCLANAIGGQSRCRQHALLAGQAADYIVQDDITVEMEDDSMEGAKRLNPIPKASVQYNDMVGSSAIDWRESHYVSLLAESKGIDISRYQPIGFSLSGTSPHQCSIYAIDKERLGGIDWAAYTASHGGALPVVCFSFSITFDELKQFMERIDIVAFRVVPGFTHIDLVDEVSLEP